MSAAPPRPAYPIPDIGIDDINIPGISVPQTTAVTQSVQQGQGAGGSFAVVGQAGRAIADNYYDAVLSSIQATGNVPGPEQRSNVGVAWQKARSLSMAPEVFVSEMRRRQPSTANDWHSFTQSMAPQPGSEGIPIPPFAIDDDTKNRFEDALGGDGSRHLISPPAPACYTTGRGGMAVLSSQANSMV
ncbi:MAG: hypothetical protein AB7V46_00090 [Thermomicrobiales bacterium]